MPPHDLAGRYRLTGLLGRGGMAEVHRAADLKLGRDVAVKVLLDGAGDERDRARFLTEARTLAMLSHSGLVTIYDAGFGSGTADGAVPATSEQPFLVMELVEGPSLAQRIAEGPLLLDEVGSIGVQVAEALAYVHAQGIVHRDVKPGNVLLGSRRVKLADFGIARLLEQTTRHTRTGHAMGTAAYLAPEQVRGGDVRGAADVYSLGLVLLEAITGRREFSGPATEAALARLSRPVTVPDELPAPWPGLLVAMTALEPDDRPAPAEVAATLRGTLPRQAPSPTIGEPDPMTAPLLADGPAEVPTEAMEMAPGPTRALTDPLGPTGPPPSGPPPSAPPGAPPAGPPLGPRPTSPPPGAPPAPGAGRRPRTAENLLARLRATPADVRGIAAGAAVLLLLLVAAAIAGGPDARPELPDNTPTELQDPLEDLHVAVNGEDG